MSRADGAFCSPEGVRLRGTNVAGMWQQDSKGRVETPFEPLILAATLAMIPVLIVQRDANSHGWKVAAEAANWVIWAIFAAEIVAILIVGEPHSPGRAALGNAWRSARRTLRPRPSLRPIRMRSPAGTHRHCGR
jgi:hypothetical protein